MQSPLTELLGCTKGMKSALPGTPLWESPSIKVLQNLDLPHAILTPDRGILSVTQIND